MKYKQLGSTGIDISLIGLGTMTWGEQNSEADAHQQLDYAIGQGVNFIDTAEMYPFPAEPATYGRTEAIIGSWFKKRKKREGIILATKVCGYSNRITHIRDGNLRLDSKNINAAVEASLKRLQTDYIDLYQIHWPDRDTNCFGKLNYFHVPEKDKTPIEETMQILEDLIKAGKIRFAGISNETPWGVAEYLRLSGEKGWNRIVSIQNPYNLLNRTFEIGLSEFSHREQLSLLAYSPTAFGTLSGKYLHGQRPKEARITLFPEYKRYLNPQAIAAVKQYVELAEAYKLDPIQMALAFVNTRPFITSTIIGATNLEQLRINIASAGIELPKEVIKGIEKIHTGQPNPCP